MPSIRARWDFRGRDAGLNKEGEVTEGQVRMRMGLEVAYAEVRGQTDIHHNGRIDGTSFKTSGPLRGDYQMHEGTIAMSMGMQFDSAYLGGLLGLGLSDIRVDVYSGGQEAHHHRVDAGIFLGAESEVNVTDWLDLYGRVTTVQGATYAATGSNDRLELGFRFRIAPHIKFATAYNWWSNNDGESTYYGEVDLKSEGLLVGLELKF